MDGILHGRCCRQQMASHDSRRASSALPRSASDLPLLLPRRQLPPQKAQVELLPCPYQSRLPARGISSLVSESLSRTFILAAQPRSIIARRMHPSLSTCTPSSATMPRYTSTSNFTGTLRPGLPWQTTQKQCKLKLCCSTSR